MLYPSLLAGDFVCIACCAIQLPLHFMKQAPRVSYQLQGVFFVLLGAIAFSGKAILAKLVYLEYPLSVSALLVMRMGFSLPFFLYLLFRETAKKQVPEPWSVKWRILGIGVLGYYISSYFDFWGLQYISAGLERIILFTYPAIVVLVSAWIYKAHVNGTQLLALVFTYLGVGVAYFSDIQTGDARATTIGSLLIFGCAFTYAFYVIWSARIIPKVGSAYFSGLAMQSATVLVILHFIVAGNDLTEFFRLPWKVYGYMLIMAIFTTVIPVLLIASGLKRIGSSNVAIISAVGPLATIFMASYFLGESFGWMQGIGTALVITGVLLIGRKIQRTAPTEAAN